MQRRYAPLIIGSVILFACFMLTAVYIVIIRPAQGGVQSDNSVELTNMANIGTATAMAEAALAVQARETNPLVHGAVTLAGGKCCLRANAGESIDLVATFDAQSEVGAVVEMRFVLRLESCDRGSPAPLYSYDWIDFHEEERFPVKAAEGWTIFSVSAQFRDVQGNISDVLCVEIGVEGVP